MSAPRRRRNPGAWGAQGPVHATLRAKPVLCPSRVAFEGRPAQLGSCSVSFRPAPTEMGETLEEMLLFSVSPDSESPR